MLSLPIIIKHAVDAKHKCGKKKRRRYVEDYIRRYS